MSAACPVFGVIIRLDPTPGIQLEAVLRALRTELLQSRGLVATILDARAGEMVITGDGFQASDTDRTAIVAWLSEQPEIDRYDVSQLGDVGHAA
jgi:hypothetical protein